MSNIKNLVESTHPVYSKNLNFWNFLLNSYEGGREYIGETFTTGQTVKVNGAALNINTVTNLFKYKREREDDFKDRVKMSYYYNFCAPIIDIYTNHLFKKPILEDWKSIESTIKLRKDNIDRKDGSIYEFRKELAEVSQLYGHSFVICDMPNPAMEIRTLKDQIDNGIFPYFTITHPQDVINWSLDVFGRPYWVLVREERDANQDPFTYDKDNKTQVNYRLWTTQEWILYDNKYDEIRRASHGLGIVPIVCVFNKKSKR